MIALVDCNNFFASCERLFRPDLRNRPVLVLSNNDGCIVARSNEVKALGIPMGEPYFKVRDDVVHNNVSCFSSNFSLYSNISQRILSVLAEYAPELEVYSIDEAFLNLKELAISDYAQWAEVLRLDVQRRVGMPVSIGIAPTKTLAKLASGYAKKHQQSCYLNPGPGGDVAYYSAVLSDTPVGDIWGVGRQLNKRLQQAGVRTALDVVGAGEAWLKNTMGVNGSHMWQELSGVRVHQFDQERKPQKTLMASRSFGHSVRSYHELETAVASFASQAAFRLRKHQQVTGVFGIYLRHVDKDSQHGSSSATAQLSVASNDTAILASTALGLLANLYDETFRYKKAGVYAYNLGDASLVQQNLLAEGRQKRSDTERKSLMEAMDSINERYGGNTLHLGVIDTSAQKWHAKKERMSPAYTTNWSALPPVYPLSH